jgi:hypothetical protein
MEVEGGRVSQDVKPALSPNPLLEAGKQFERQWWRWGCENQRFDFDQHALRVKQRHYVVQGTNESNPIRPLASLLFAGIPITNGCQR